MDDIIRRLLETSNGRTAKQAKLLDVEIRQLCSASKDVFLSQPNLLELEAPIKICGTKINDASFFNLCIASLCCGFLIKFKTLSSVMVKLCK